MRKLFDQREFRERAERGDAAGVAVIAPRSKADGIVESEETRTVRFILSDNSVDRVGDTISVYGWETDNYMRNPVILWAHDSAAPPIGRMRRIWVSNNKLMGDVEFIDAETYAFADTVFRMVISGYISAGSVGFLPLKWQHASENSRPYGIDFIEQELLEFSICPIPANSNALVAGKRMGLSQAHLRRLGTGPVARRTVPRRVSPEQGWAMQKAAEYRYGRGSELHIAWMHRVARLTGAGR